MNSSGQTTGGWLEWLEALEGEIRGTPDASWLDRMANLILDKVNIRPGMRVADLGAGTGLLTLKAAACAGPRGEVHAVDTDPRCLLRLERACMNKGFENVLVEACNLEELPFDSEVLDVVVCRSALCYSERLDVAVGEIYRVLRDGGRFSALEPLLGELTWFIDGGEIMGEFFTMERILKESRGPSSLDRRKFRQAFKWAGFDQFESVILHRRFNMGGREEEEIYNEYLYDLPGGISAFNVLKEAKIQEEKIFSVARTFASLASRGKVKGELPCILIWGAKQRTA